MRCSTDDLVSLARSHWPSCGHSSLREADCPSLVLGMRGALVIPQHACRLLLAYPMQLHGAARGQRAATGVAQTGSHSASTRHPRRAPGGVTKTGEKADASRRLPQCPASCRHAERVSGAAPGIPRLYSYAKSTLRMSGLRRRWRGLTAQRGMRSKRCHSGSDGFVQCWASAVSPIVPPCPLPVGPHHPPKALFRALQCPHSID